MTTADRAAVLSYLREQIAKHLEIDVAQVPEETPVFALPGVDSLKAMRVMTEVEQKYGITAPTGATMVTSTVGELADLLHAAIQESRV